MGKKGGKKGNLEKAVEDSEANLPVIIEEDQNTEGVQSSKGSLLTKSSNKSKSILKSTTRLSVEASKSMTVAGPKQRSSISPPITIVIDQEEAGESGEKKGKGKKDKNKKTKKEKPEADDDTDKEKKAKSDKKASKVSVNKSTEEINKDKKKTAEREKGGKKGKKEKAEQTDETEKKEKKGKGKKDKPPKETKGTQKDVDEDTEENEHEKLGKTESKLRARQSKVSFHQSKTTIHHDRSKRSISKDESTMMLHDDEKRKRSSSSRLSLEAQLSQARLLSSATSGSKMKLQRRAESIIATDAQGRKLRRYTSSSRLSTDTDYSTDSSDTSSRFEKEERGKKKKGKKDKKEKKEKGEKEATKQEKEPETEEEIERKKAEKLALKEAKKAEKKAAKLAAKQEAAAAAAAAAEAAAAAAPKKTEKPGAMDYDDVKKYLEDLKKFAKGLGVELMDEEGDQKGPKKKMSKKEKAKLTAEAAEKQKAALEAETKRIEELIKKKKEEDRLAAIDKDRRETIEHGIRMEQLKTTYALIQDITETNADIVRQEKETLEWQKYVECGYLPNPMLVNQMNTYLHLWELILDETNMDAASKKTTDAIKLLSDLDEIIDTVTEEEQHKVENWKWVRQLFREYQAASLDVATYRLIRDVEHNLNRINIPTADFNFQDDYVTLCLWLRVMLPIPLPNPRRPPKSRIEIFFNLMNVNVLFPVTIDCQDAAIRAMYLKYDHFSDICATFEVPEVPKDYHMDLLETARKEWRFKLKYKYDNRDKKPKYHVPVHQEIQQDGGSAAPENLENPEHKSEVQLEAETNEQDVFDSDEEIPIVPFKQLKPTANEYAGQVEGLLYNETRAKLITNVPEHVINLRKFVILGGVYHLHLLAQPPQPQDFITMEMSLTGLYLPKKLEVLPFQVVYTPYIPPEPQLPPPGSTSSISRKLPEEIEEEIKKHEEELDKLISINIKWPQHVIFLELPIVCRWDEEKKQWSKEEIHDLKHNEDKCILSFRTGVFGIYGLAAYRYANLPFQAYDIKPETDQSITVQLTAAILMLEFNIKDGLISITQLQNSPNMTLQNIVGKYFKLHQLKRMLKEAGIDIFPGFDAFCYVDGCCEKQWAMEKHLYYNMAQMSNSFNFAWSRWNLQAGRRRIVLQMRQYSPESKKQKSHQMLLVSPRKACFIECTEVSQVFLDKEVESLKPVVGQNGLVQDKMSLNTLLEAAKFLEMQEQRQQHRATLETALTTATIRPVTAITGGATHMQNGNNGTTQTITLQPVKLINATTPTSIGSLQGHQSQPTQTVVISSNNISSTFLQGVQGPITFTTASPTSATTSPQTILQNGIPQNGTSQIKKEQDGHISSTTMSQTQRHRVLNNSFDIINPLVIDEGSSMEQKKIKQPPLVFRSGTREVHNKLEKHRRAHLKECFDILKKQLPTNGEEKKTSNLSILHSALRYIQNLKRRERDLEHEMERLAREKIGYQQRLATLKKDISTHFDNVDFSKILPEIPSSTTSITQNGGTVVKRESGDGLVSTSASNFIIPTTSVATSINIEPMNIDHTPTIVTSSEFGTVATVVSSSTVINQTNSVIASNGESKISIPILGKMPIVTTTQATSLKEVSQPVQTTGISVLPMSYPNLNQGLVLQKVAIVPHKGLTDLAPLMSTTHFITTPQQLNGINGQINGKVVPLTQYIVKPMVVVSSASPRPGS